MKRMRGHATGDRKSRVVVGVSGSITGLQALRQAVHEARRRGAALCAVRVWSPPPVMYTGDWYDLWSADVDVVAQARQEQALEAVREAFAAGMGGPPPDLEWSAVVVPGPAGPALVRLADRPDDLLVLGWTAKRSKVVRYCLRNANCPTMAVPPPPLARVSPREVLRQTRRLLTNA